jgi:hypothetical protein
MNWRVTRFNPTTNEVDLGNELGDKHTLTIPAQHNTPGLKKAYLDGQIDTLTTIPVKTAWPWIMAVAVEFVVILCLILRLHG